MNSSFVSVRARTLICGALLISALPSGAQEIPDYVSLTAAEKLRTEYVNAQAAGLKADAELKKQQEAEVTAAEDKKKQEQKDLLVALAALGDKMPKGEQTITSTGVATPRSKQIAYANLATAAAGVWNRLYPSIKELPVIFASEVPAGGVSNDRILYLREITAITTEAARIDQTLTPATQTSAMLIPLISALPGILNAIGGLTRVDITENTFKGDMQDTEAAAVLAKLIVDNRSKPVPEVPSKDGGATGKSPSKNTATGQSDPTAGQTELSKDTTPTDPNNPVNGLAPDAAWVAETPSAIETPKIYFSLDNYIFQGADFANTDIANRVTGLSILDGKLEAYLEAMTKKAENEEKAVTKATADVAAQKAKIDDLKERLKVVNAVLLVPGVDYDRWQPYWDTLTIQLEKAKADLVPLEATLTTAKDAFAKATALKPKVNDLRDRIAKVFKDFRNAEGTPPLFARLLREDLILSTKLKRPFRIISLHIVSDVQAYITEKSFLNQKHYHSAFVGLQFTLSDGTEVLDTGIFPVYNDKLANPPPAPRPTSVPPAKRQ